jgi:hypothetical protein
MHIFRCHTLYFGKTANYLCRTKLCVSMTKFFSSFDFPVPVSSFYVNVKAILFLSGIAFFAVACGQNDSEATNSDSISESELSYQEAVDADPQSTMNEETMQALLDEKATKEKKIELQSNIESLEKKVLSTGTITEQSQGDARNLVNRYHEFATLFPKDEVSPEYLFRAADVLRGMGSHIRAVSTLNRIEKRFPDHRHVPEAVFLQGFIYDAFLNNPELARQHLESFVERFPGHELEASARNLLLTLDSSPEDLIERFRKDGAERNPEL